MRLYLGERVCLVLNRLGIRLFCFFIYFSPLLLAVCKRLFAVVMIIKCLVDEEYQKVFISY